MGERESQMSEEEQAGAAGREGDWLAAARLGGWPATMSPRPDCLIFRGRPLEVLDPYARYVDPVIQKTTRNPTPGGGALRNA